MQGRKPALSWVGETRRGSVEFPEGVGLNGSENLGADVGFEDERGSVTGSCHTHGKRAESSRASFTRPERVGTTAMAGNGAVGAGVLTRSGKAAFGSSAEHQLRVGTDGRGGHAYSVPLGSGSDPVPAARSELVHSGVSTVGSQE